MATQFEYPQGLFTVIRHRGETPELSTFGIVFQYTGDKDEERVILNETIVELRRELDNLPDKPIDAKWPSPNIEDIAIKLPKVKRLGIMVCDDDGCLEVSASEGWRISDLGATYIANREKNAPIDLVCHDLLDAKFSVRLREQFGVLVVEPNENEALPKMKYWEFDVLAKLRNNSNSAFGWWEYE